MSYSAARAALAAAIVAGPTGSITPAVLQSVVLACTDALLSSGEQNVGTLAAARLPAFSGDVASSAGSAVLAVQSAAGAFSFLGVISPTALVADQNDYTPAGLPATTTIRLDAGGSNRNISGLLAGSEGRTLFLANVGATGSIILNNESTSSLAANRFELGADYNVFPGQTIILKYDATTARWRSVNPMGATGVSAGSYGSASQVGTFTVDGLGRLTAAANAAIAINANQVTAGQLAVARGGTGLASGTSGGVLAYTASGVLASSGALTQYGIVLGGGAGAAPTSTAAMSDGQLLVGQSSAAPLPQTLSGDATLAASGALTLASTISAGGPTGGISTIPIVTYDAKGRLTAVSTANVLSNRLDQFTAPNASVSWNSQKITNLLDPTAAQDAATKNYVDLTAQGFSQKPTARLATAAALAANTYANGASGLGATLTGNSTGVLTVDGVSVALNDIILVKNEATGANNGLYQCTTAGAGGVAYVLTRHVNMDVSAEFKGGFIPVDSEGTANANSLWLNTNTSAPTVGTTAITFVQLNKGTDLAQGTGITISGNTVSVATNGITNALLRQGSGLSVIGVTGSSTANVADIVGTASQFLGINAGGTALAFQTLAGDATLSGPTLTLGANAVSNAKFRQGAAVSVVGVTGNATANVADIAGTASQFFVVNAAGTSLAFQTMAGDATLSGPTLTLAANAVTNAKFRQGNGLSVVGVTGQTTGNVADIIGTANQFLGVNSAGTSLAFQTMSGDAILSGGALTIAAAAVSLSKMANLAANSIIGNNTGSPATPVALTVAQVKTLLAYAFTDISGTLAIGAGGTGQTTAANARGSSGLNIDEQTGHGDSNYTILNTDRVVATTAAFTAPRTWTLPAANTLNAGQLLAVLDLAGGIGATNTLTISRAGSDTVQGTTTFVLNSAGGGLLLWSDGTSKWSAMAIGPAAALGVSSWNGRSGAVTPANDDYAVTQLAAIAANSIVGNNTGSSARPIVLTVAQVKTLLAITLSSDVTGTLQAAQFPALTGDVTTSSGSLATTIAAAAVTYAKIANGAGLSVIGRSASSAGVNADIAGTASQFLGVNSGGTAVAFQTMSGDATLSGAALTIANNAVSNAKFRQGVAVSVVGVAGNATANVADITGTGDQVLRLNHAGTALAFGAIDLSQSAAATGVLQAGSMPALTGDVTNSAGALATTIAAGAVTLAKMANLAANSFIGNNTGSPATPIALTVAQAKSLLAIATSDVSGYGTFASAVVAQSQVQFSGAISPTALSGDVNDYNPTSLATAFRLRQDGGAADRNITGLSAQSTGTLLCVQNVGSSNKLILKDGSVSSSAANRFQLGGDITLNPNQCAFLVYDGTLSRWTCLGDFVGGGGAGGGTVTSVAGAGLITGTVTTSGNLTVTASSNAQAQAGTDTTTAMTPAAALQGALAQSLGNYLFLA